MDIPRVVALLPSTACGLTTPTVNRKLSECRQQIATILSLDDKRGGRDSRIKLNDSTLGESISNLLSIANEDQDDHTLFHPETVAGTWRVVHAPHLWFLANFALAKFRPIEYFLAPIGEMSAFVQYKSILGNFQGWLCTSGTYTVDDDAVNTVVRIVWDKCWWNIGDLARPITPDKGDYMDVIQSLGMICFIDPLSFFPRSLCR